MKSPSMGKFLIAFCFAVAIIAAAFFVSNQFPDKPIVTQVEKPIADKTVQKTDGEAIQPTVNTQVEKSNPPAGIITLTYIALNDNGQTGKMIGCGDSAVSVIKNIPVTQTPLKTTYETLLADHNKIYGQSGLYNGLYQSNLQVDRVSINNGTAIIKLTGQFQQGGVCDAPRIKAQLEDPALQFASVKQVEVFINNIPLSQLLSGK